MLYQQYTLHQVLGHLNAQWFLPHIQRPFIWSQPQIKLLFDSLMRGYPIQTFLVWRTKEAFRSRRFMDCADSEALLSRFHDEKITPADVEKWLILDGQQRLQSLFALFKGTISTEEGKAHAYFDLCSGPTKELKQFGQVFSLVFAPEPPRGPQWLKLSDLIYGDEYKTMTATALGTAINKKIGATDYDKKSNFESTSEREETVRENTSRLIKLLKEDQFWFAILDGVAETFDHAKIVNIFDRINSTGTKLEGAELLFAAMSSDWDECEKLIDDAIERLRSTGIKLDKSFGLKCLLAAHNKGTDLNRNKLLSAGKDLLPQMAEKPELYDSAFRDLTDFLKVDIQRLSGQLVVTHNSLIPLFVYLFNNPGPDLGNRRLMRAYYYKAQFFKWYSKDTDGVVGQLNQWVAIPGQSFPIREIKEHFDGERLATELRLEDLATKRLHKSLLSIVYVARNGVSPFDVASSNNSPEVDHIYPKALLKKLDLPKEDIDDIGNLRFVGRSEHRPKGAKTPSEFFADSVTKEDRERHLLVREYVDDPSRLKPNKSSYARFRMLRSKSIWRIVSAVVNAELSRD